jgi:hypothetical protein
MNKYNIPLKVNSNIKTGSNFIDHHNYFHDLDDSNVHTVNYFHDIDNSNVRVIKYLNKLIIKRRCIIDINNVYGIVLIHKYKS